MVVLMRNAFPLIIVLFIGETYGARILCIASVPTLSHNLFFRPIWKGLADRGHELTVLTPNPMEEPYQNIKEIDLSYVYERKTAVSNLTWTYLNWPNILQIFHNMFKEVAVMELTHPEVQTILTNETEHFDLVIAEMHIPLMFGFAHRYKCPLIGISSAEIITEHHILLGNPGHPLLYPDSFSPQPGTTFTDRILAIFFRLVYIIRNAEYRPILQELLKTYFGPDVPALDDLIRNIHFVFINTHPVLNYRPMISKCIAIGGGTHIDEPKPLPKDLQNLLDQSSQGVVYYSLGTNIKIQQYPVNFINTTIEAFRELPYQVIWKFNYEIPNVPQNVKVFKWLPQQDLLRHKNVKVFITQGGLHSKEEAIHAEVPMLGIPFISDQNKNVWDIVNSGIGLHLDKDTFTKDELKDVVKNLIENPRYKQTVIAVSKLLKDQPMTGLQKAIWYAEYAIRNKEPQDFLKNPNLDLPWYQYIYLDVIGAALTAFFVTSCIMYQFLKIFGRLSKKIWRAMLKKKID